MKKTATGIYRTATGFRVFVRLASGPGGLRSKRFPAGTLVSTMKAWREDQRVDARRAEPAAIRGSFAEDVETYLGQVAAMPTIDWRRRDLYVWREAFGDMRRAEITAGMIRAQLNTWRTVGPVVRVVPKTGERRLVERPLSASACNHRRTALLHLYAVLDGKAGRNPVRDVPAFPEPIPEPRARDLEFLEAARRRIRNRKDRARVGVLLWTGARGNSELGRMKPEHVDLEHAVCHIPTGKGGDRFRVVTLNARGVSAWREFATVRAWGHYSKDYLRKSFARACRREAIARELPPTAVRPYDLRHSIATALLKAGADLSDVQDFLGHSTSRMTRRYAPFQRAKLAAATTALEADVPSPPAEIVTATSYRQRRKRQDRKALRAS